MDLNGYNQFRRYEVTECIAFRKTSEAFGGLSNMAPGFTIMINNQQILTSEALYQACRFPNNPEIQKMIIQQRSPMIAKDISKKYIELTRSDWDNQRIKIMRWCLRAKLVFNWFSFGELLEATIGKNIVEDSGKDLFWGAKRNEGYFEGVNALGRLLMQLREQYIQLKGNEKIRLEPLDIPNFKFMGEPIKQITVNVSDQLIGTNETLW